MFLLHFLESILRHTCSNGSLLLQVTVNGNDIPFLCNLKLTDKEYLILNDFLSVRSYLGGFIPTETDNILYKSVTKERNTSLSKYDHLNRWYNHLKSYTDDEKSSFPNVSDDHLSELVTVLSKANLDNKVNQPVRFFVLKC